MPEDSASTKPAETRRLAAIMFTDIVGFSRQMGSDEARMLRLLEVHNRIIQKAVSEHHGAVIKTVGDAFLVDFPSVVHAVQCAQYIQAQFRIEARQGGQSARITVSADQFAGINWVADALGAHAILAPGPNIREHVRSKLGSTSVC
jgi:class 3 adenylate cyclase